MTFTDYFWWKRTRTCLPHLCLHPFNHLELLRFLIFVTFERQFALQKLSSWKFGIIEKDIHIVILIDQLIFNRSNLFLHFSLLSHWLFFFHFNLFLYFIIFFNWILSIDVQQFPKLSLNKIPTPIFFNSIGIDKFLQLFLRNTNILSYYFIIVTVKKWTCFKQLIYLFRFSLSLLKLYLGFEHRQHWMFQIAFLAFWYLLFLLWLYFFFFFNLLLLFLLLLKLNNLCCHLFRLLSDNILFFLCWFFNILLTIFKSFYNFNW